MKLPIALQSRKFWFSAIGVLAGLCLGVYGVITSNNDMTNQGVTLIMLSIGGYIAAEGTADVITRSKQGETDKLVTLAKLDGELSSGSSDDSDSDRDIVSGH